MPVIASLARKTDGHQVKFLLHIYLRPSVGAKMQTEGDGSMSTSALHQTIPHDKTRLTPTIDAHTEQY